MPTPTSNLRARVVGEQNDELEYFRSGLVNWHTIDSRLRRWGFDPTRGGRVLDFGVGSGRILQFFALYAETCSFVGADVDAEAVKWCRENLDFVSCEVVPTRPPTPFKDAAFDAIYAFSVFSHLREDLHRAWLEELHRIAKPEAVIVVTVQGSHVVEAILENRWQGGFPPANKLRSSLGEIAERGFGFFPYGALLFPDSQRTYVDALGREEYGSTFILERYVRSHWSELFEIVTFDEAPDAWQDYVVLRPR